MTKKQIIKRFRKNKKNKNTIWTKKIIQILIKKMKKILKK